MANGKSISKIHQRVMDKNRLSLEDLDKQKQEQMEQNNFWDLSHEHYNNSLGALTQVEGTLRDILVGFIQDKDKLAFIKDQAGLANNINILTKDIAEHVARLNTIYAKHSHRTGGTTGPDEHMELLHLHGEYAEALEIYQANIVPIVSHILEQIGAAETLIALDQAQKNKDALTDPTVVSDVEVKMATPESTQNV